MMMRNGVLSTPPVVKNLMILNALVFMAQELLPYNYGFMLTRNLALYFWESPNFQIYQYVTHMFLHANFQHLLLNMFSLWMFGRIVENDMGSKRFLTFYLITGIGAAVLYSFVNWGVLEWLRSSPGNLREIYQIVNVPTVGASGAIFGVLLAFGMMHPNAMIMLLIPPIPMKAKYFVIIFMVLELVQGFTMTGNVAHFAHVTGMVSAFLLLRYWKAKGKLYY